MRRVPAVWLLLALAAVPYTLVAQKDRKDQQPGFAVRVNQVSLDVEVLDRLGNPVLGLTKQDFLVKENSKPMDLSHFTWASDRPVSLGIVLDTSAISNEKLGTLKRFIIQLAHMLARTDDLCLYSFDSRDAYLEQDFTPNRGLIMGALENIGVPSGGSGGVLKELFGPQPPMGLAIDLTLRKLGATNNGKKALLVVSNRFRGTGPATVEHVQQSGCTLLTLGFNNKAALLITLGGDQISKNQLMKESGGRQFSAEGEDITGVCRRIAYSLKNYYALGYLTEIGPVEEKPRRVDIRIPGHNYTINFRRSYIAQ
jgi:VWFA-related protein